MPTTPTGVGVIGVGSSPVGLAVAINYQRHFAIIAECRTGVDNPLHGIDIVNDATVATLNVIDQWILLPREKAQSRVLCA